MKQEDYIRLGFTPLPHYTVAGNLIYNLGRNRQLSAGCVGTPNEMVFLCQMDDKDPMITTDLVCVHNWDYDKEMTEEKLTMLIKALSGGVDSSTESGGENGVLYDVSVAKRKVCHCLNPNFNPMTDRCHKCGGYYYQSV